MAREVDRPQETEDDHQKQVHEWVIGGGKKLTKTGQRRAEQARTMPVGGKVVAAAWAVTAERVRWTERLGVGVIAERRSWRSGWKVISQNRSKRYEQIHDPKDDDVSPITSWSLCAWKNPVDTAGNSGGIDLCEADESRAGKHDRKRGRNNAALEPKGVNRNADVEREERDYRWS